ncbi:histidine phosphatase family protein [Paractinoplanes atraurantiacus]|uniref:Broad specificity phosphatase PhoE n=1 Tax=Paractinoplanes atraurantiacus TaxID=1036182 RepID=A0A285IAM8_9ACTN|nr:histidine phosphatase family protein [Actinoplanes atraurantiacus]SNY45018.1 Broad specificity phosphatase PhoE [Actinoplanes atraurantiacus]
MIFVRHAMPVLDPAVPPARWHLGDEGRAAARLLRLPRDAYLVASDEPKAVETLRHAVPGAPVHQDPGFAEVHRPAAWQPDHRTLARAYVAGTHVPDGWEPPAAVTARFDAAVDRHRARAGTRLLVVATHGMALTCWLTAHALITADPARFWAGLRFPDLIEIDPADRKAPH